MFKNKSEECVPKSDILGHNAPWTLAKLREVSGIDFNEIKYNDEKVVFFGHYWQKGLPKISNSFAVCLDLSAVKNGFLCSYRHDNTNQIKLENFIYV